MTAIPKEQEDRLNLRPVVLGVCFFWGLLCGFLINVLQDPDILKDAPAGVRRTEDDNESGGNLSRELLTIKRTIDKEQEELQSEKEQPPEEETGAEAEVPPEERTGDSPPSITAERPAPPPLLLRSQWGMTGRTARHPTMPLRIRQGPEAPRPVREKELDDLPPPELDLPE